MTAGTAAANRALRGVDFPVLISATTRWADNDMFGHLNNAVYYELFDTAINGWIISAAKIDVLTLPQVGVVAESGCHFYREVGFPQPVTVGLGVTRIGRSSVTYQLGLFAGLADEVASQQVAAVGHWVHVYVERESRKAATVPEQLLPHLGEAVIAKSFST